MVLSIHYSPISSFPIRVTHQISWFDRWECNRKPVRFASAELCEASGNPWSGFVPQLVHPSRLISRITMNFFSRNFQASENHSGNRRRWTHKRNRKYLRHRSVRNRSWAHWTSSCWQCWSEVPPGIFWKTKRRTHRLVSSSRTRYSELLIPTILNFPRWSIFNFRENRPTTVNTMTMAENSFIKKLKSSGRRLVVFYGSQTGTAEEFAGRLAKEGLRYQMKGMVADPEECDMVSERFRRLILDLLISILRKIDSIGGATFTEGHRQIVGCVLFSYVRRGWSYR